MFQETTIIGILGRDPVMKTVNGKISASFSVATNRYLGNGREPETTWFNVTVWENTAETICKMAQKGTKIFCKGRLVCDPRTGAPRVWQKNDGTWGSGFELVANTVKMLSNYKTQDSPVSAQVQAQIQQQRQEQSIQQEFDIDDIPF